MEKLLAFSPYIDLMLVGALLFFALRTFKQQGNGIFLERTAELEKSLRMLIGEAERAGSGFNEALLSKRSELEKLLFDLQNAEHRVGKMVEDSEEERKLLRLELERLKNQLASASNTHTASIPQRAAAEPAPAASSRGGGEQSRSSSSHGARMSPRQQYYEPAPIDEGPPTFAHSREGHRAIALTDEPQLPPTERIRIPAFQAEVSDADSYSHGESAQRLREEGRNTHDDVEYRKEGAQSAQARMPIERDVEAPPTHTDSLGRVVRPAVFPRVESPTRSVVDNTNKQAPTEPRRMHSALGAKPLHERIEVQRTGVPRADGPRTVSGAKSEEQLSRVVRAAETLLRAGLGVSQVSAKTTLPEDEVMELARKLGVLQEAAAGKNSPVRRRRETL